MSRKISWNIRRGMATSAIWKAIEGWLPKSAYAAIVADQPHEIGSPWR